MRIRFIKASNQTVIARSPAHLAGRRSNPSPEIASATLGTLPRNDGGQRVLLGVLIFLPLLFLGLPGLVFGQTQSTPHIFHEANQAYREGNYSRAASLYESFIEKDGKVANVYYNLGNAYFKWERLGLAILNYEKAKRLSPRDRDLLANLAYVKGLLEYRVEDKRNWYLKMGEVLLSKFTQEEAGMVTLTLGLFFWMSWILPLYSRREAPWGWRRKTLLLVTLGCLSLWILKGLHDVTVQEALTLKPQAAVRYGPSHKDQVAFRLGEGIKVRIKKRAGERSRVVLTNGETGWMFHDEFGVI